MSSGEDTVSTTRNRASLDEILGIWTPPDPAAEGAVLAECPVEGVSVPVLDLLILHQLCRHVIKAAPSPQGASALPQKTPLPLSGTQPGAPHTQLRTKPARSYNQRPLSQAGQAVLAHPSSVVSTIRPDGPAKRPLSGCVPPAFGTAP